jgi:hypothetical protein
VDQDEHSHIEELLGAVPMPVQIPPATPGEYAPHISEDNFDQDAWDEWYREQIRLSIEDPRPDIPHDQVMREIRDLVEEGSRSHGRIQNA